MKASRELDLLVARHVMGWRNQVFDKLNPEAEYAIPHYSSDISAVWEVVEKMKESWYIQLESYNSDDWIVSLGKDLDMEAPEISTVAESAPLAICLASLKACGVEYEKIE